MTNQVVKPYKGDPFTGHLATPISASGFTQAFIGNLPAYRKGVSPLIRGLEVGLAHGYFLAGPWTVFGPLRDYEGAAALGGLIPAVAMIMLATACLSAYGLVTFSDDDSKADYFKSNPDAPENLQTGSGWGQFTGGFFIGAMGGAFVAYFLLANFAGVDAIFRGLVN
ncbi:photosystem I reaction center protein subunit XI [Lusitaniella coriacea LEGE 07157]|uniref:Photosystem I reaction center subunit XI n=1 Tax=Lusitaniella coriacea LEGE 07157 TaxID=945747 RepID=A0A8J7DVS7_9CYAN|nr:photosystem I reaction center protein subunit XI [Lusitaniella coriacea]MBE9115601.1 photosystem I reaction center protein subunit XI [Lusitaniella coriacea LEGE 07157]